MSALRRSKRIARATRAGGEETPTVVISHKLTDGKRRLRERSPLSRLVPDEISEFTNSPSSPLSAGPNRARGYAKLVVEPAPPTHRASASARKLPPSAPVEKEGRRRSTRGLKAASSVEASAEPTPTMPHRAAAPKASGATTTRRHASKGPAIRVTSTRQGASSNSDVTTPAHKRAKSKSDVNRDGKSRGSANNLTSESPALNIDSSKSDAPVPSNVTTKVERRSRQIRGAAPTAKPSDSGAGTRQQKRWVEHVRNRPKRLVTTKSRPSFPEQVVTAPKSSNGSSDISSTAKPVNSGLTRSKHRATYPQATSGTVPKTIRSPATEVISHVDSSAGNHDGSPAVKSRSCENSTTPPHQKPLGVSTQSMSISALRRSRRKKFDKLAVGLANDLKSSIDWPKAIIRPRVSSLAKKSGATQAKPNRLARATRNSVINNANKVDSQLPYFPRPLETYAGLSKGVNASEALGNNATAVMLNSTSTTEVKKPMDLDEITDIYTSENQRISPGKARNTSEKGMTGKSNGSLKEPDSRKMVSSGKKTHFGKSVEGLSGKIRKGNKTPTREGLGLRSDMTSQQSGSIRSTECIGGISDQPSKAAICIGKVNSSDSTKPKINQAERSLMKSSSLHNEANKPAGIKSNDTSGKHRGKGPSSNDKEPKRSMKRNASSSTRTDHMTKKERSETLGDRNSELNVSESNVMYIGRLPHGFYEKEMMNYFSQFGVVNQLRISRSSKTGRCRGYGFIEFEEPSVAAAAVEATNGYMMHSKRLRASLIPLNEIHPALFKDSNRRFSSISAARRREKVVSKSKNPVALSKKARTIEKRLKKRSERLHEIGIIFMAPDVIKVEKKYEAPESVLIKKSESKNHSLILTRT